MELINTANGRTFCFGINYFGSEMIPKNVLFSFNSKGLPYLTDQYDNIGRHRTTLLKLF